MLTSGGREGSAVSGKPASGHGCSGHGQKQAGAVAGDAVPQSLTGSAGDAARGRAIIIDRQKGFCLLCHSGPFSEEPLQGNLAPSLEGAGSRWNEGQLRLRLMDNKHINPESIMPAYHRIEGLNRVGAVWRDRPILNAAEIEDVLAFLRGLTAERAP